MTDESTSESTSARAQVLVIDDEPTIVELVSRMLRRTKLRVHGVNSGEAGVDAMREHQPIVVLTDKNLPGMSGMDVIRAGREIIPDSEFIVMTGYASLDSALAAIELGVFAYLTKPFARQLLTDHVTAAAEQVRKRRVTASTVEHMRTVANKNITGPIAIRQGLGELDEVVHKLERLVSSLSSVLKDDRSKKRDTAAQEHLDELNAAIGRLSELKGQL